MDKPIRCECGKVLAVMRNGKIYIKCKGCKRQVELEIIEEKPHKITH
jgi:phage FluMu protein Com